ncbi:hypothetical protein CPB84DRAFT_1970107 [Gymnopilus junonius]|uniref:Uncharacterized protein n=1 Tax=Gymnopilus junonius TaxID=109634 RepID=A0A9P5N7I3_GYMJU|nr:hypothetical protein CPB84DRAFT_1970107 [Gymnopilus junonius]
MSKTQDFPNIPFSMFAQFVDNNFSSRVLLATVLTVLFSMTENPDLLNLHARQKCTEFEDDTWTLFQSQNRPTTETDQVDHLSYILDDFATTLKLTPQYNGRNELCAKVQPVSYNAIQAAATTSIRDIPLVSLIKGNTVYHNVPVFVKRTEVQS